MDLLDEIEFKEQQISRLNNLLNRYKEQEIPENNQKKNLEKSKQLPFPFFLAKIAVPFPLSPAPKMTILFCII